ncbi:alanyl-tRNA editing protein [Ectobacillus ponti]|uniref:Alanyl-tRNA editing protein n=1 Tax=Ectobacillus ponti TaxID=2961894 RepID=A0AA41X2C1_9BACI|nr:alanyl-tRNA editing protein [Ectobacillus ponti]MCP8967641.1 alanyl-tRNA editing protein [Ectobacillus ponti]
MVRKVFWEDPYLTELDTTVVSVNGNEITVEDTIFYAFSGGQESDAGTIGGCSVLQAVKQGKEIIYTLPEGHGLAAGDKVLMCIDWDRRYRLMRLHFAAELILELVYQHLGDVQKIGAHIAQDKSRIDFALSDNIAAHFPLLQERAHALITANHDIISSFSEEETERRTWEIHGFSKVPCGGTHLKRTGEVGSISLKRKNIGKGKERIEIYVS